MKPYYEEDGITIYHGDCRELLPQLSGIGCVLTDPPYGIALSHHGRNDGRRRRMSFEIRGDGTSEVGQWAIDYLQAIPLIAFASPMRPWAGDWDQYLCWDKGPAVGGGGDPETRWKFTWELIQVARLGALKGLRDVSVLRYHVLPSLSVAHPAEKPENLCTYLIRKAGFTSVTDPFMGTGTALVSARRMGVKGIGIEIEERYCEIAAKRLAQGVLDLTPA